MVSWDDLDNVGPIKVYDKHVERAQPYYESFGDFQLLFSKEGDITIPRLELAEPLKQQDSHFIDCVQNRVQTSIADGEHGVDVVRVLEAVQASLAASGAAVALG